MTTECRNLGRGHSPFCIGTPMFEGAVGERKSIQIVRMAHKGRAALPARELAWESER